MSASATSAPEGYSRIQIWLHWIVALLIAAQFLLSDAIEAAWRATMRNQTIDFDPLVPVHVFGGILILVLILWRLALRFTRGTPPPPENEHPALKLVAHVVHWTFYALLVVLAGAGLAAWFGGIGPAAGVHGLLTNVLLVLIGLHVVAALFHQFVLKTDVMTRMKRAA